VFLGYISLLISERQPTIHRLNVLKPAAI